MSDDADIEDWKERVGFTEKDIDINIANFFYCRICGFKDENRQKVKAHIRNNHVNKPERETFTKEDLERIEEYMDDEKRR